MKRELAAFLAVAFVSLPGAAACGGAQDLLEKRAQDEMERGRQRIEEEVQKGQKKAEEQLDEGRRQVEREVEKGRRQVEEQVEQERQKAGGGQ